MGRRVLCLVLVVCGVLAGCGSDAPSIPPPEVAPSGSLLVLETEPCNWLLPPDPDRCDAVGLARIDLDGGLIEDLTPESPMSMRSFAYSSTKHAIAWTWNWEIGVMPLEDGRPRIANDKLTDEHLGEFAFDPTWSPDGSELLYRWTGINEEHTWYRLQVETGDIAEVSLPVDCWALAWSPDGERIVCEALHRVNEGGRETERADLYLIDLASLEAEPLTEPRDAIDDRRPEWSPDGQWLAFSRWTDDQAVAGIWVVDMTNGQGRRIAVGTLSVPTWSPDGGYLAAYDDTSGQIVILGRDGSGLRKLSHEPRRFGAPRWLPSAEAESAIQMDKQPRVGAGSSVTDHVPRKGAP